MRSATSAQEEEDDEEDDEEDEEDEEDEDASRALADRASASTADDEAAVSADVDALPDEAAEDDGASKSEASAAGLVAPRDDDEGTVEYCEDETWLASLAAASSASMRYTGRVERSCESFGGAGKRKRGPVDRKNERVGQTVKKQGKTTGKLAMIHISRSRRQNIFVSVADGFSDEMGDGASQHACALNLAKGSFERRTSTIGAASATSDCTTSASCTSGWCHDCAETCAWVYEWRENP
jgi:hypothetical protein